MSLEFNEYRLDDIGGDSSSGAGEMLRGLASAAAGVRSARSLAREAGIGRLSAAGRPRSIVVVGLGTAALAGDAASAILGNGCPVPIHTVRSGQLPGWVGGHDLVVAVSAAETPNETLAMAEVAARRGCRLLVVAPAVGALAELAEQTGSPAVPVTPNGVPRDRLWSVTVPILTAVGELDMPAVADEVFESTAVLLEELSYRYRADNETFVNAAKSLAVDLAQTLPLVLGSSTLTRVAADRLGSQLAVNATYPALVGGAPEALHSQIAVLDGPFGGAVSRPRSIFDDPVEDQSTRLRVVAVQDSEVDSTAAELVASITGLASERGVATSEVVAEGRHPMERMASLIALIDYATVYLAVAYGVDPTLSTGASR